MRVFLLSSVCSISLCCGSALLAQAVTETHDYDALGRVIASEQAGANGTDALSYCFDELGNRVELKASTTGALANCAAPAPTPAPSPTPTPTPTPTPPSNTPPVTVADYVSGPCGSTTTLDVTDDDTDAEDGIGSPVLVSVERLAGPLAAASVYSSSHVQVVFAPTAGDTSFNYTVEDSDNAQAIGSLFVTSECGAPQ